jgi:hypothetical protein
MTDNKDFDPKEWGRRVAQEIIDDWADAAALDTACYRICSFLDAAAKLALEDSTVARRIGAIMEPPREMDR